MKKELKFVDQTHVASFTDFIIGTCKSEELKDITHIIGVSRGGLPVAVHVSNVLDLPLVITDYSSSEGNGENPVDEVRFFDCSQKPLDKNSVVLIIDDIIDTGKTIEGIIDSLNKWKLAKRAYVSSIVSKKLYGEDGWALSDDNKIDITHIAYAIVDDDAWYVFPWEVSTL